MLQQDLRCPKCGGRRMVYAGTTTMGAGGYGRTDARYTCKDCGYTGPLVIDVSKRGGYEDKKSRFQKYEGSRGYYKLPIMYITALLIITLAGIGLGEKLEVAILFFLVFAVILTGFFYMVGEDVFEPVEKDLENLDEEGEEKR